MLSQYQERKYQSNSVKSQLIKFNDMKTKWDTTPNMIIIIIKIYFIFYLSKFLSTTAWKIFKRFSEMCKYDTSEMTRPKLAAFKNSNSTVAK